MALVARLERLVLLVDHGSGLEDKADLGLCQRGNDGFRKRGGQAQSALTVTMVTDRPILRFNDEMIRLDLGLF